MQMREGSKLRALPFLAKPTWKVPYVPYMLYMPYVPLVHNKGASPSFIRGDITTVTSSLV